MLKLNSDNLRGAAFMAASMAAYVLNDTMMKLASNDFSLFQAMFLRGIFATVLIGLIAWHQNALHFSMSPSDRRIILLRVFCEVGATLFFLNALFNMPLANATAILQSLPLVVTLAAAVFLREAVGWRRYLAIIIGFAGILIIIRPGTEGFNAYSYSALAAVAFITVRDLSTRRLSSGIPSLLVSLVTSVMITVTGAILSPTMAWQPVDAQGLLVLFAASIFLIFAYLFSVMTMRVGEISFVSPFRYTVLIWAILLGIFVFGEVPDLWTLIGTLIIVVMGIYTFYRERQAARLVSGD